MIVFDLSRPNTLDSVKKWKADIDSKVRLPDPNESPIPVVLLANKVGSCLSIPYHSCFSVSSLFCVRLSL
jgi:hypothetical protein